MAFIANEGVAPKGDRYDRSSLVSDTENKVYKKTDFGDFIYSSNNLETGSIGLNKFGKASISPVYSIFQPTGIADSDFLGRRLVRKDFINAMVKWRQGVIYGQWRIHESDFVKIEIPVPTVEEQRQIGAFLDSLDNLITLHLREFTKSNSSIFVSVSIYANGLPAAWELRKLGELALSFEYGLNAAAMEYDGVNKYLRITDIDDETHEFKTDALTTPDVDLTTADNYRLKEGDVLFARTGASVGKTYRYKGLDGLVYFAGFLIRARIKPECDAEFVFQNTLTDSYNRYITITSQRSGQPGVNAQEYAEFELTVPGLAEQRKIGSLFHILDNLITLHLRKYSELFL